jgi:hypothetical protein
MRTFAIVAILALLIPVTGFAQTTVTVDPAKIVNGFMNVYNLPAPDGDGAFQFPSGWGLPDLTATYSGSILTLGPNTIGDPDPYWYIGGGGPGAPGNKIMEANCYAEETGPLAGQTVVFTGTIVSNTLTSAHTVTAFIRDFAPDFSSFVDSTIPLTGTGDFTVSLATINDPGRHVQYGFQMVGVNVWVTDVAPFGTIAIAPDQAVAVEAVSFSKVKALFN